MVIEAGFRQAEKMVWRHAPENPCLKGKALGVAFSDQKSGRRIMARLTGLPLDVHLADRDLVLEIRGIRGRSRKAVHALLIGGNSVFAFQEFPSVNRSAAEKGEKAERHDPSLGEGIHCLFHLVLALGGSSAWSCFQDLGPFPGTGTPRTDRPERQGGRRAC
jgi:hypothetical protein